MNKNTELFIKTIDSLAMCQGSYSRMSRDIHNAIDNNLHIIKHICGNKTDILSWIIDENKFSPQNEFNTYII